MRAGTANAPTGGIGGMGTATSGTHTRFNNCLSGGASFAGLVLRMPALGDAILWTKINMWNNFNGFDTGNMNSFMEWMNLMGDPSVWIWTSVPQEMTVTAPATIQLGTNTYSVIVEDGGEAVKDAWVTLYKNDEDETIIARGQSDAAGAVTLSAPVRFEGSAILTVTKQNYEPVIMDVDVTLPTDRIGYSDLEIVDDGSQGTSGNNNGVAEAGETVGIRFTATNFGTNPATNVQATASSSDPWALSVTGTSTFGAMDAGQSVEATGLILVEIDANAQQDWLLWLDVSFTSGTGTYNDHYAIEVAAARFALVNINLSQPLNPGTQRTMTIRLKNIGGSPASGSSDAQLLSMDPFLNVTGNTATYGPMAIGAEATSTNFTVVAHPEAFPGHIAQARLIVTTSFNQVDTVYVTIPFGSKTATDPSGPDSYGYYAFGSNDVNYDNSPDYDWVEINPSAGGLAGTNLNLGDNGNEQDAVTVITLPFTMQYYGEEFSELSVCSNGWVAMGRQPDRKDQRTLRGCVD